jgi:hypothetical protein
MTDAEFVREIAQPLSDGVGDYDGLLELIGRSTKTDLVGRDRRARRIAILFDHERGANSDRAGKSLGKLAYS